MARHDGSAAGDAIAILLTGGTGAADVFRTLLVLVLSTAGACVAQAAQPCVNYDHSKVFSPARKSLAPAVFNAVRLDMTMWEIVELLGPAQHELGSGLMIFGWNSADGRVFLVGGSSMCEPPMYARFDEGSLANKPLQVAGRPRDLKQLVEAFDIRVQASTSGERLQLCRRILTHLTSADREPMVPTVSSASFGGSAMAPIEKSCPSLDVRAWDAPDGSHYQATRTFRVFTLPKGVLNLDERTHFILFAESYFSPAKKEQYRGKPKIYPRAGFAWPDGNGGGAIYSVVDRSRCEFQNQLVVHGEYNVERDRPTPHFSEPFILDNRLHVYDFHDYSDETHNYAGIVVWDLSKPNRPRQTCVFDSADARAQINQ